MNDVESTIDSAHKHILVSGKVQGVWYRQSTMEVAQALQLTGWVRNLPDGRVEIQVHGPTEQVERLIQWCHEGPPLAEVTEVWVEDIDTPITTLNGFRVTH